MDYFSRQTTIEDWDQAKLENSTCVCFGVGGLGSVVALNLCRLGVGKIILMDYDVVDSHNLNRQLLYSRNDVGQSKAERAKLNLESSHNICSQIEAYDIDIVQRWGEVVSYIENPTVIFNLIDYGDYFDMAAQSLALSYGIPLV